MAAADAQFYWMSAKIPNDEFLLYAFAGVPDLDAAAADSLDRARACPDLAARVEDARSWAYPCWVTADGHFSVTRHRLVDDSWTGCLDAAARLGDEQLDIRRAPWRLHLFAPVRGIPGHRGTGSVVLLQMAHALADGVRAAALAGWMFGRPGPVPAITVPTHGFLPLRAVVATRAHRRQVHDVRAGLLPAPPGNRPLLASNNRPAGARTVRTLVRRRAQLAGPTVTVGVLAAISAALSQYLGGLCNDLGAEVPMSKAGVRQANNHFGNVGIGLYPLLDHGPRTERIAEELKNARLRARHPSARASDRAFAATPAALLRWGIGHFDPNTRPNRVTGNTVVSSVYRGPADLHFGGAPVLLTAGFPALSPAMGLTHGVHGIGDTVAVSVHAAESAIADVDGYLRLLDAAL